MVLIKLNRKSRIPLFRQITEQLIEMIGNESLKPGDRLPSTRLFARQLGVNRTTVCNAYDSLWAMGYTESGQGFYTRIRKRATIVSKPEKTENLIDWSSYCSDTTESSRPYSDPVDSKSKNGRKIINFLRLAPDTSLIPVEIFRKCMNTVLTENGGMMLDYGDPMGYRPLREYIADHLGTHGITANPENIIITNGAQNALELVLKVFTRGNTTIITESPTYSAALPLFRYYGIKVCSIPMTPDGMDTDTLEQDIVQKSPAFVYTMPNFQNPTGITTSQSRRESIMAICEKYRVPVVEDGFEEDMTHSGEPVLPLKSIDRYNIVLYIGTFSKVLFPGLRIGWLIADEAIIREVRLFKEVSEISGIIPTQAALDRFCRSGHYGRHLMRFHRIYRKRMQAAMKAARIYFPKKKIEYTRPTGGYTIWLTVKNVSETEEQLAEMLFENGVLAVPGRKFFTKPHDGIHFRLSIGFTDEEEIEEGFRRIGEVFNKL